MGSKLKMLQIWVQKLRTSKLSHFQSILIRKKECICFIFIDITEESLTMLFIMEEDGKNDFKRIPVPARSKLMTQFWNS